MRKHVSWALILVMTAVLLIPGTALADSADLRSVLQQLNSLSDTKKAEILSSLWDSAVDEIGKGNAVDADDVLADMKAAMGTDWGLIVGDGSGKITEAAVKIIIQKLLSNKSLVISYYTSYKDLLASSEIKVLLGLDSSATPGQVMVKVKPYFEGALTSNSANSFVRNGDAAGRAAARLGALPDSPIMNLLKSFLGDVNSAIDQLAGKINNSVGDYGLTFEDAVFALKVFGLYSDPSTGGGGGGGGGPAVTKPGHDVTEQGDQLIISAEVEETDGADKAELSASVIKDAWDEGFENVVIKMPDASITIPSGAVDISGDEEIELTAGRVDTEGFSDELKEQIGDAPVFEFELKIDGRAVSEFNTAVRITIPYTPKPGEDPEKITVYHIKYNSDGTFELVNMTGVYDADTGTVSFSTTHFSRYVVKVNDVTFSDIGTHGWARKYIEVMASKGIIYGKGGGVFSPGDDVTRAEFAAMVVRALKLTDENAPAAFSDVKAGSWYFGSVNSAAKWGLVSGRSDGTFAPDEKITRQDMAVILANALQKVLKKNAAGESLERFIDRDSISSYAVPAVRIVVKYSIMEGKPEGLFSPKANTNRAEAAAVVYRLFYTQ